MPRSKSRNRKRKRSAKKRKREKESLDIMDQSQNIKKMESRLKRLGIVEVSENQSSGRKISSVIIDLISPLLDEAISIKEEREIIQMGIMAWNLGVIKTYKGEDAMLAFLQDLRPLITEAIMDVLMEYVKRKSSKYKKYDQFICDYEINELPGPKLNLTVAYKSVNQEL